LGPGRRRSASLSVSIAHHETEWAYKIQSNDIIVAFCSIELDSEPTRIASSIGKLSPQSYRGESHEYGGSGARTAQEICLSTMRGEVISNSQVLNLGQVGHIAGGLKVSKRPAAARMDHAWWALPSVTWWKVNT
jgi:hypothetical protein